MSRAPRAEADRSLSRARATPGHTQAASSNSGPRHRPLRLSPCFMGRAGRGMFCCQAPPQSHRRRPPEPLEQGTYASTCWGAGRAGSGQQLSQEAAVGSQEGVGQPLGGPAPGSQGVEPALRRSPAPGPDSPHWPCTALFSTCSDPTATRRWQLGTRKLGALPEVTVSLWVALDDEVGGSRQTAEKAQETAGSSESTISSSNQA